MKKFKKIFALLGAILLILLYASTIIFAMFDSEYARRLLMASIVTTIALPVMLYGFALVYKLSNKHDDDDTKDL